MIETGSEYQLLQHFEALPIQESQRQPDGTTHAGGSSSGADVAVSIDPKVIADSKAAVAKLVDGTKFETFLEALVNIIVVIPVK